MDERNFEGRMEIKKNNEMNKHVPDIINESKTDGIISKSERTIDTYMQDRLQFKINLYFRRGNKFKVYYYIVAVLIATSAAFVPVLVNVDFRLLNIDSKIWATIFSLVVSIGVALQEIFHFREHWRNYNLIDSNLRSEEMLFSMSAGAYAGKKDEEKNRLFVQRVEELIKDERWETINMRTSANRLTDDPKLVEGIVKNYLDSKNISIKD
jgi:hypothetical protein